MSVKKLIAIILIFIATCVAWIILGGATLNRTNTSFSSLRGEVVGLYGEKQFIQQPDCFYVRQTKETYEDDNGVSKTRMVDQSYPVRIDKSAVSVDLKVDYRKKGVLWFPTYKFQFSGEYTFSNPLQAPEKIFFKAGLGSSEALYDDVILTVDGVKQRDIGNLVRSQPFPFNLAPGQTVKIVISYRSTGLEVWNYMLADGDSIRELNDFSLRIDTDFKKIDFSRNSISPVGKVKTAKGWSLDWTWKNVITGKNISVIVPNRLNPGDITTRVTFFAPVALLFYLFLFIMISMIRKVNIHPMNYFFLATAFFAFHLVFSYFSDNMNIYLSFTLASLVSIILASTYLRLFTPPSFAFVHSPLAQFVYLVVFSFSFFFKGVTGMILTIVSVATIFLVMQMTGKIDWDAAFAKKEPVPRQAVK